MSRTPSPDFSALSPKEIRKLAAIPDGMLIPPTNPAPSTEEEKARQFIQIFEPVLKAIIDDPYCFDICKTSMPVEQRYQELMMSLAEKRRHQEGLSEAAVAELAKAGKPNLTFTYTDDKGNATVKIFEPTAEEQAACEPLHKEMSVLAEKYFNHARSVAKEAAEDNNLSLGNSDEEAAATLSKITATARDIIMQIHAQQAAPKQLPQPPLQQLPPRQHKKSFTRGL